VNDARLLRIDLERGTSSRERIDQELIKDFIGGRGLGTKYLFEEVDAGVDPFSPENKLIFATGPLTGTHAPTGARGAWVTKSPLSGTVTCPVIAGFFPSELRRAGYDVVVIEGKAKQPVYVWITNDQVEIRPSNAWGKDTHETCALIRAETAPRARLMSIGPPGERLARIANIISDDDHAAGRGGVGAVMGSKNLKAIAVLGTQEVPVADQKSLNKFGTKVWKEVPKPYPLTTYGTLEAIEYSNQVGLHPTRNFQAGVFEGWEKIGHLAFHETVFVKASSCYRCPIACGRVTEVTNPAFATKGEGPHYEGLWALGSCCGIDNLEAITKAYHICNEMGLDAISIGATIACAMEMYERGILSENDIGLRAEFGNAKAMVELVRRTGSGEGFGALIGEGSYRMAEKYGHPEYSMSVKKQELAGWDPRGAQGMALGYATSNRGGDHMKASTDLFEVFEWGGVASRFSVEGKAELVKNLQDETAVMDSMGLCYFLGSFAIGLEAIVTELEMATGVSYGSDGFMKAGERIWNLEKLFNLKTGFGRKDDTLPKRLLQEPMTEGPSKGYLPHLHEMLPEYYSLRGWDTEGIPTPDKLKELGLA